LSETRDSTKLKVFFLLKIRLQSSNTLNHPLFYVKKINDQGIVI